MYYIILTKSQRVKGGQYLLVYKEKLLCDANTMPTLQ